MNLKIAHGRQLVSRLVKRTVTEVTSMESTSSDDELKLKLADLEFCFQFNAV